VKKPNYGVNTFSKLCIENKNTIILMKQIKIIILYY